VQIYGTLNVDLDRSKPPARSLGRIRAPQPVTSNAQHRISRQRRPGLGLKAFFQIESAVNFNDGTSSGFWASRNSGVGLQGGWGQFLLAMGLALQVLDFALRIKDTDRLNGHRRLQRIMGRHR